MLYLLLLSILFSLLLLLRDLNSSLRRIGQIKRWKKALKLDKHYPIFQELFQSVDGFKLSQQARIQSDAIEYTYGEIEFYSFTALLSLVELNDKTIFYDLGSGLGKAVIACAMVYPVGQAIGIELLTPLYQMASQKQHHLAQIAGYNESAKRIQFISGDFLQIDINNATCIFINSTTMFGETWEKLGKRLDSLPHLKTVITTSRPLDSKAFKPYRTAKIAMSWGVIQAYIHNAKN